VLISKDENYGRTADGDRLIRVVRDAGAYIEVINGEECLSKRPGRLMKELVTKHGVPEDQIPRLVGNIISMLFGDVGEENFDSLVQSYSTYAAASERT
jgi:hypothetical protein